MIQGNSKAIRITGALILGLLVCLSGFAQEKAPVMPKQGPVVNSPEVLPDGRVVFRILAPKAESVGLQASDIPGLARGGPQFAKAENGVWEATIGPVAPGAYRYTFMVNGVAVVDPRNPSVSEIQQVRLEPGLCSGAVLTVKNPAKCRTGAVAICELLLHCAGPGSPHARVHAADGCGHACGTSLPRRLAWEGAEAWGR